MSLSAEEREITLILTEADDEWEIYSSSGKMDTKLKKAGIEPYKEVDGGKHYKADINQISFRKKSERTMSEEQRQAASERFKKMHAEKKKLQEESNQ